MKRALFALLVVFGILLLARCQGRNDEEGTASVPSQSLEDAIAGNWASSFGLLHFRGGVVDHKRTGQVFGSYQVIDSQTLRFKRDHFDPIDPEFDVHMDIVVTVEFPDPNTMVWTKAGRPFRKFERVADRSPRTNEVR